MPKLDELNEEDEEDDHAHMFSTPSQSHYSSDFEKIDSPQSPMSGKFTQDEEFTDPEDPITVVKTALHIDKVTLEEERERKIREFKKK